MTNSKTQPYVIDDLFRPKEEGRSLHDHASSFYRNVMKLGTPIRSPPTSSEIVESTRKLQRTDEVSMKLVTDLQATEKTALWPDLPISSPHPPTTVGVLWYAAHQLLLSQLPISTEKSLSKSPKGGTGRKKGTLKWTSAEIDILLSVAEGNLPAGKVMWEKVALDCTNQMLKWTRTGESCKNKFEKLAFQKKPTGTAEIPVHVAWAKRVKEKISESEMIGYIAGNDANCSSLGGRVWAIKSFSSWRKDD